MGAVGVVTKAEEALSLCEAVSRLDCQIRDVMSESDVLYLLRDLATECLAGRKPMAIDAEYVKRSILDTVLLEGLSHEDAMIVRLCDELIALRGPHGAAPEEVALCLSKKLPKPVLDELARVTRRDTILEAADWLNAKHPEAAAALTGLGNSCATCRVWPCACDL